MAAVLISVRDSARLLADTGLTFEQCRLLLRTGIAGPGTPVGGAVAYDAEAVARLAQWPEVDPAVATRDWTSAPWAGLYVARLSRTASVDLTGSWAAAAEVLGDQPVMTELSRALLAARIAGRGRLPWVATMFGFVLFGADAVGVRSDPERGRSRFELEPPSAWWSDLSGTRLRTRRGRPGLVLATGGAT